MVSRQLIHTVRIRQKRLIQSCKRTATSRDTEKDQRRETSSNEHALRIYRERRLTYLLKQKAIRGLMMFVCCLLLNFFYEHIAKRERCSQGRDVLRCRVWTRLRSF